MSTPAKHHQKRSIRICFHWTVPGPPSNGKPYPSTDLILCGLHLGVLAFLLKGSSLVSRILILIQITPQAEYNPCPCLLVFFQLLCASTSSGWDTSLPCCCCRSLVTEPSFQFHSCAVRSAEVLNQPSTCFHVVNTSKNDRKSFDFESS